jgi:hypothetical protein
MKKISYINSFKKVSMVVLSGCLFFLGNNSSRAEQIFSTDFSKGSLEELGWVAKGDWKMVNFGADRPKLANNPGPVLKFPANGKANGTLTKKFAAVANPANLTLTFDGGYGWGAKNHSQGLNIMILDDAGNGYLFNVSRANADWGAQWNTVENFATNGQTKPASTKIDTTQKAVVDGGGLRTFVITRDAEGNWSFNSTDWVGGPMTFTEKTFTSFSQVVLFGTSNTDDVLYNNIKLEVTK